MSGSLALVLVLAVCVVGLLALAAATFFPRLSLPSRRRPERGAGQLTDLADRLSPYAVTRPAVIDLVAAERPEPAVATAKATKKAAAARKTTGARKAAAPRRSRAAAD